MALITSSKFWLASSCNTSNTSKISICDSCVIRVCPLNAWPIIIFEYHIDLNLPIDLDMPLHFYTLSWNDCFTISNNVCIIITDRSCHFRFLSIRRRRRRRRGGSLSFQLWNNHITRNSNTWNDVQNDISTSTRQSQITLQNQLIQILASTMLEFGRLIGGTCIRVPNEWISRAYAFNFSCVLVPTDSMASIHHFY